MLRDLFSLFPAYAGVILKGSTSSAKTQAFPRICGGDPRRQNEAAALSRFSPHMRG